MTEDPPASVLDQVEVGDRVGVSYVSLRTQTTIDKEGDVISRDEPPAPCGAWFIISCDSLRDDSQTLRLHTVDETVFSIMDEEIGNDRGTYKQREIGELVSWEVLEEDRQR